LNPDIKDGETDFDDDGFSNLIEYLGDDEKAGNDDYSDPIDGTSFPQLTQPKEVGMGEDLTFLWIILAIVAVLMVFVILCYSFCGY
jgi:hypothetical protein